MKHSKYYFAFVLPIMLFVWPQISYAKDKLQPWAGTYELKGGNGGLLIEKEGKRLWIEMWRDYNEGEERWPPGNDKYKEVYFASIHGNTAKRLPFRGDICPETLIRTAEGIKLIDDCSNFSPIIYFFERIK